MFDFNEIRKLVELVQTSGIGELEVTRFFSRVKIRRQMAEARNEAGVAQPEVRVVAPAPEPELAAAPAAAPEPAPAPAGSEPTPIRSPMVGTFYASPAPDAEPYVSVGQRVKRGQVVCIIEAMKLMNEIESEVDGTVVKILVENAQPVQYDEVLFQVETG